MSIDQKVTKSQKFDLVMYGAFPAPAPVCSPYGVRSEGLRGSLWGALALGWR